MVTSQQYARYYFLLFAAMGIVSPYIGWWIDKVTEGSSGFLILACFYFTMVLSPSLWSHAAFSSTKPGSWLSVGTLMTAVFAIGLSQVESSSLIASCFLMLAFGLFYTPLVALLDALAYSHLEDPQAYSRVRLYGSWGFLVFSSFVGGVLVLGNYQLFPLVVSGLMLCAWVASLPHKKIRAPSSTPEEMSIMHAFREVLWPLRWVWFVTILSQIAFVMYYVFFALHLKNIGFSNIQVGILVGVASLAEIVSFWKIKWFFEKSTAWMLIVISSIITAFRWFVVGGAEGHAWWMFIILCVVQLAHSLSFAVFHTSCLKIIHETVRPNHMGMAQGSYNAIGYGVGGIIGVIAGAHIWNLSGGSMVFYVASVVSLLLAISVWFSQVRSKKTCNKKHITEIK